MLKSLLPVTLKQLVRRVVRPSDGAVGSAAAGKTRQEAKAEYEAGWSSVLETARSLSRSGERNLARVLSLLERPGWSDGSKLLLDRFGFRFCGVRVRGPQNWSYEAPLFELLLQNELLSQIDPDTERIVELGSGYGKNLFRIWLNGGPQAATYYGLEFTRRGRECADFLAALEPAIRFRSQPFDYHHLDLRGLTGEPKKTFVFTCYSIEQVPEIDDSVVACLAELPGVYKVMHVEPVGWQRQGIDELTPEDRALLHDMERSARACRYNVNLLEVLERLAKARRLEIKQRKYDFLAHRPDLPGSIIVWRPLTAMTAARPAAA
jgi:hypothetical protein